MAKKDRDFIYKKMNQAIKDGLSHSNVEWRRKSFQILYDFCCSNEFVTANDVTPLIKSLDVKTYDNRAIGGIFKTAVSMGWVAPTGRKIQSKNGHFSMIEIWKSLVYGQGDIVVSQNKLF